MTPRQRVPELYCPLPPKPVSEHALAAEHQVLSWATRHGVIDRTDHLGLGRNRTGHLSGFVHPWACEEAVRIGALWVTWLFAYDDAMVTIPATGRPDVRRMAELRRRILAVLGGARAADDEPLVAFLGELMAALQRLRPSWDRAAFVADLQHYLDSNLWEIGNFLRGRPPRLGVYLKMRRHTSAYFPCFQLSAALADIRLPFSASQHVAVEQLTIMANNYGSWLNDVYSLERELADGSVTGLIQVLRQEYGCGLQEAVERAADMCRIEMESYLELKSRLPELDIGETAEIDRYLCDVLESWMRGILDWHRMTPRYSVRPDLPG